MKCTKLNSERASWIRAANCVGKKKLIADRFHLMKYINRVARYILDEENLTKSRLYKYIYKNRLLAVKKLPTGLKIIVPEVSGPVEECRTYLTGNWEFIERAFHDTII